MKQIVPFTKKIKFDTNVDEVTSISLDKKIKEVNDGIISGIFELYLEYKESDISIATLKYDSTIPFDIDIDEKYDLKNVKVDIDDFYYDIDESEVTLHIDVLIDNLELIEEKIEIKKDEREEDLEIEVDDDIEEVIDVKIDDLEERDVKEETLERDDLNIKIEDLFKELDENITDVKVKDTPLFKTFDDNNETFVTYNVHIVREEDNIETICLKYGVTKEELSYYNDINIIKLGDKLIVPTYKK